MPTNSTSKAILSRARYRSRLEERIAAQLEKAGCPFEYESQRFPYTVPARVARYTPDFILNGRIIVESKGRFRTTAERQKMVLFKEQHPKIDIRLVFMKAALPIYKGSKTTYASWADTHGFPWADGGVIPDLWIEEALRD